MREAIPPQGASPARERAPAASAAAPDAVHTGPVAGSSPAVPHARVLHLQRALGNAAVGRLLAGGAPSVQRDIRATRTTNVGTMTVDFEARNPLTNLGRASEKGVITFEPGDGAPNSSRIFLEQLAKTDGAQDAPPPDRDDRALAAQTTRAERGAEGGFFVDQVVAGLRARLNVVDAFEFLGLNERFAYGNTGDIARVPLHELIKAVGRTENDDDIPRATTLSLPQVKLICGWATWAMEEKILDKKLDAAALAEGLVRTAMRSPLDEDALSGATGIDASVWRKIRAELSNETKGQENVARVAEASGVRNAGLRRDAMGFKKGDIRSPASLYDEPSSKYPLNYAFKTAPIDSDTGDDLGIYARWGFNVAYVPNGDGRVCIQKGSEFASIEAIQGSSYRATASQARGLFDEYWANPDNLRSNAAAHLPLRAPSQPVRQQPPRQPTFDITRYGAGAFGVYFFESGGKTGVAKPLPSAYNEMFAFDLGMEVGLRQPRTTAISLNDPNDGRAAWGRSLVEAIQKSAHGREFERSFKQTPPAYVVVMEQVKGESLTSMQGNEATAYRDPVLLLDDIGMIAAFDLLLGYRDRTAVFGGGNLENVIVDQDNQRNPRATAIDSRVKIGQRGFLAITADRIKTALEDLAKDDSEAIGRLWKNVPLSLRNALGGDEKGKPQLAASVQKGLRAIATTLTPDKIDDIARQHAGLQMQSQGFLNAAASADKVDVAALKDALALIQKAVK